MDHDNKKATLELGTKPVGHLLLQYAMPAIIAMTAASLYNIIDRIFIGQVVGPLAISGLAITFPFMNLSGAFGAAVGVGSSTAISVKLGQRDYKTAEELLGNTVTLNLIIGFFFTVICLLFLDPILRFFGASDDTIPYARDFMQIILLGNMVTHMYFGMNAVLRAASKPRQAMYATVFTVVMNILLDVVFILWLGWGIRGAALATVISQVLALVYQMRLFTNKHELLHLKRGIYRLKASLVKNIIGVGISPFLMNVCACIIVIFMNNQFVRFGGDLAVGAFGVAKCHWYGVPDVYHGLEPRHAAHIRRCEDRTSRRHGLGCRQPGTDTSSAGHLGSGQSTRDHHCEMGRPTRHHIWTQAQRRLCAHRQVGIPSTWLRWPGHFAGTDRTDHVCSWR